MTGLFRIVLFCFILGAVAWVGFGLMTNDRTQVTSAGLRVQNIDDETYRRSMKITDATFQGRDDNNQPLDITAGTVVPNNNDYSEVSLSEARANLRSSTGQLLDVASDTGVFNRSEQTLQLRGDVVFKDELGLEVRTESANVDLRSKDILANAPVQGEAEQGSWNSEGMEIRNNGNLLILTGRSEIQLLPSQFKTPKNPDQRDVDQTESEVPTATEAAISDGQ